MAVREVVLHWTGILAALLGSALSSRAVAQEASKAKSAKEPPRPTRFFRAPVDFWRKGLSIQVGRGGGEKGREAAAAQPVAGPPAEWGFTTRLPDGQMAFQSLPAPLVAVLEDPSREKVEAYFAWRVSRAAKILRAAEAIKAYREEVLGAQAGPPTEPDLPPSAEAPAASPPPSNDPGASGPVRLTYFHRKGCPHCDTQSAILTTWLAKHPDVSLEILEFGERPELWRKNRVRGTPSLLFEAPGGSQFIEGLAKEPKLEQALAACRGGRKTKEIEKGGTR